MFRWEVATVNGLFEAVPQCLQTAWYKVLGDIWTYGLH